MKGRRRRMVAGLLASGAGLILAAGGTAVAAAVEVVRAEGPVTASLEFGMRRSPAALADWARYAQMAQPPRADRPPRSVQTGQQGALYIHRPPDVGHVEVVVEPGDPAAPSARWRVEAPDFCLPLLAGKPGAGANPPTYRVTDSTGRKLLQWRGFGSATDQPFERYRGSLLADTDVLFDSFWKRNRADVDRVPLNAVVTRLPERDTPGALFHRVELDSTDGARIAGWYLFPKSATGPVPAILILPGYGAEEPPSDRSADGFATLALSPRAHGPSKELGWKADGELLLHNITRPESYFYVLAVQDAVQGVRFLDSQTSVGPVGVEGGSQGGLLALGAAALCPREVQAVCSNVPCFSDYPFSMATALAGPHVSLRRAREAASRSDLIMMNAAMGLTDGAALSARVRQPLQVVVGNLDTISPAASGFAIYNRSPAQKKSLVMLASEGHALPPAMQSRNREWFRKHLSGGPAAQRRQP